MLHDKRSFRVVMCREQAVPSAAGGTFLSTRSWLVTLLA